MSQSELARRVKLNQSTIAGLITGKARSSAHLHRIARELGTTPAYLTGETDDPEADAPPMPELTGDRRELLEHFDVLPPAQQRLVMELVRSLAGTGVTEPKSFGGGGGAGATLHAPKMEYHGK
jgi:transcriptional regulator with XRE-family HTH domain